MILGMILTKFLVKLGASNAINIKTTVKIDFPCVYIHHLDQRLIRFRTSDSRSE